MDIEDMVIKDGKALLAIVFKASRLEFQKLEEEEDEVPAVGQGSYTKVKATSLYLLKNWKRIHADDRAMGEAGLTQDIAYLNSLGFSVVGTLSYLDNPGKEGGRSFNAMVKIVKSPEGRVIPS